MGFELTLMSYYRCIINEIVHVSRVLITLIHINRDLNLPVRVSLGSWDQKPLLVALGWLNKPWQRPGLLPPN